MKRAAALAKSEPPGERKKIRAATKRPANPRASRALSVWLRAGRIARGVSLEELGKVLQVSVETLTLVETARWLELPRDLRRELVSQYARAVGLRHDRAMYRYDLAAVENEPPDLAAAADGLRAWCTTSIARGAQQVSDQQARLRDAGVVDVEGRRVVDLPDDMLPGSRTDV
ncbi:MAG: helix-turn-helix domain-containing protein [Myxococcales bacterium]|nr:helix-turn-helix domain-containing protein [Myxococcales bacterium]